MYHPYNTELDFINIPSNDGIPWDGVPLDVLRFAQRAQFLGPPRYSMHESLRAFVARRLHHPIPPECALSFAAGVEVLHNPELRDWFDDSHNWGIILLDLVGYNYRSSPRRTLVAELYDVLCQQELLSETSTLVALRPPDKVTRSRGNAPTLHLFGDCDLIFARQGVPTGCSAPARVEFRIEVDDPTELIRVYMDFEAAPPEEHPRLVWLTAADALEPLPPRRPYQPRPIPPSEI